MVTDIYFDAQSDYHAIKIVRTHGWELIGELVETIDSDSITDAMVEKFRATVH